MKKQNVRTISLIVCIFTFLLVGAAIFDALESDYEAEDLRRLTTTKVHFLNKYNITEEDFRNMSILIKHLIPHNARQWKFAGAFYYSVTVMTTIGYGHSTPRTWGGKAFTMCYAFIGIPLGLVMFQSIGERLNVFATFILANIKKCFRFKNGEVSQNNLIVIDTTLAMMVVFISAAVFDHYENWGYWNAVYYCIITLTTVGFGDLVPLQSKESDLEKRPEYVVFTLVFILFGLTVVSANMNLMVLRFMTVNTEDERRDEMEAAVAALTAVKVDGDVIYGNDMGGSNKRSLLQGSDEKSPMMSRTPLWSRAGALIADYYVSNEANSKVNSQKHITSPDGCGNRDNDTLTKSASMVSGVSSNVLLPTANGRLPKSPSSELHQPGSSVSKRRTSMAAAAASPLPLSNENLASSKPLPGGGHVVVLPTPTIPASSNSASTKVVPPAVTTKTSNNAPTSITSISTALSDNKPVKVTPAVVANPEISTTKPLPPELPPHPPPPPTFTAASSVAPSSTVSTTTAPLLSQPSAAPPISATNSTNKECNPSIGQCQVPNCRHQNYCRDGPSLRNPADACPCSCHQEKAWWSYLLKTMPYSSNNSSYNQPLTVTKLDPSQLLQPYQCQASKSGEQLPLIPPPIRQTQNDNGPAPEPPPPIPPPKKRPSIAEKGGEIVNIKEKDYEDESLLGILSSDTSTSSRKPPVTGSLPRIPNPKHRHHQHQPLILIPPPPLEQNDESAELVLLNKSLPPSSLLNSADKPQPAVMTTEVTTAASATETGSGPANFNRKSSNKAVKAAAAKSFLTSQSVKI